MAPTLLTLSFDAGDSTGRGSVFVFKNKNEVCLRALVSNASLGHAGAARLFLTRLEFVDLQNVKSVITHDTLALNWALSQGEDVSFYPDYQHFVEIASFTLGAKSWRPMTLRSPIYWPSELSRPGIYRLHLLLTGATIKPVSAIFELQWPMKKLSKEHFSFSITP